MIDNFKKVVTENYTNFSGRASRSEYWYFVLAYYILYIVLVVLGNAVSDGVGLALGSLLGLGLLLPSLAVAVRRLHDTSHSGWWLFIVLIPLIGGLWLLYLMCVPSDPTDNQYGSCPA